MVLFWLFFVREGLEHVDLAGRLIEWTPPFSSPLSCAREQDKDKTPRAVGYYRPAVAPLSQHLPRLPLSRPLVRSYAIREHLQNGIVRAVDSFADLPTIFAFTLALRD